ncbi:MAG: hypothetical protein RL205_973 [Actinomycetota bacterium]
MKNFVIDAESVVSASFGEGLSRPECVLATACGEFYTSDVHGIRLTGRDGSTRLFSGKMQVVKFLAPTASR